MNTQPAATTRPPSAASAAPGTRVVLYLRVSSKSRDALQEVQQLIKDADYDFAVQFTNYR